MVVAVDLDGRHLIRLLFDIDGLNSIAGGIPTIRRHRAALVNAEGDVNVLKGIKVGSQISDNPLAAEEEWVDVESERLLIGRRIALRGDVVAVLVDMQSVACLDCEGGRGDSSHVDVKGIPLPYREIQGLPGAIVQDDVERGSIGHIAKHTHAQIAIVNVDRYRFAFLRGDELETVNPVGAVDDHVGNSLSSVSVYRVEGFGSSRFRHGRESDEVATLVGYHIRMFITAYGVVFFLGAHQRLNIDGAIAQIVNLIVAAYGLEVDFVDSIVASWRRVEGVGKLSCLRQWHFNAVEFHLSCIEITLILYLSAESRSIPHSGLCAAIGWIHHHTANLYAEGSWRTDDGEVALQWPELNVDGGVFFSYIGNVDDIALPIFYDRKLMTVAAAAHIGHHGMGGGAVISQSKPKQDVIFEICANIGTWPVMVINCIAARGIESPIRLGITTQVAIIDHSHLAFTRDVQVHVCLFRDESYVVGGVVKGWFQQKMRTNLCIALILVAFYFASP